MILCSSAPYCVKKLCWELIILSHHICIYYHTIIRIVYSNTKSFKPRCCMYCQKAITCFDSIESSWARSILAIDPATLPEKRGYESNAVVASPNYYNVRCSLLLLAGIDAKTPGTQNQRANSGDHLRTRQTDRGNRINTLMERLGTYKIRSHCLFCAFGCARAEYQRAGPRAGMRRQRAKQGC